MRSGSFQILLAILALSSTACSANMQEQGLPSLTALTLTFTPAPSLTPRPPEALLTASPVSQPTIAPIDGITSTRVNVRAEPSTASAVLGIIPPDMRVEIVGKDPGENWWQILYPQASDPDGKGWVTAQYVRTVSTPAVPVVGGIGTGTSNGAVAIIQQKLNIRSGPGTGFDSIGTLNAQDAVNLTGKDPNGTWLQIEFGSGPEGKGWINAAFAQANGVENLPIVTEAGVIVGTGTPTNPPPAPTPTVIPAWMDNDSPDNPIAQVIFDISGTDSLIFTGDVSAPEGDTDDWIAFTASGTLALITLECTQDDSLQIDILEDNLPMNLSLVCDQQLEDIPVKPGAAYLIHLRAIPSSEDLVYINYLIKIQTRP
ncbi:MAG TPA: SH3 domain-containing protein [Anaerolineales bacterium]|nr:SH3 domain-containing protein [Anaerolineales bacterium]